MKALRALGLATRKFPAWLQTFNILCAVAAVSIVAFGIYHLSSRRQRAVASVVIVPDRGEPLVQKAALEERLATFEGGAALGEAVRGEGDATALLVLAAAKESCLVGSLAFADALARSPEAARGAAADARAWLADVLDAPVKERQEAVIRELVALPPGDVALKLAVWTLVRGTPLTRRAAVDRLAALHDGRAGIALVAAIGLPDDEAGARAAAEQGLLGLAKKPPPATDGSLEERWESWWRRVGRAYESPPYDLRQLVHPLRTRLPSRDAIRGLGLARDAGVARELARLVLQEKLDPLVRIDATWALGRVAGPSVSPDVVDPLRLALRAPLPLLRIAAARAVGRARVLPLKPELVALLEEKGADSETMRFEAALALLGFLDRSGIFYVDAVAFDTTRPPAERLRALEALETAGDAAAASSRWIAALSDREESLREAARTALRRYAPEDKIIAGRAAWEAWWRDSHAASGLSIPPGGK